MPSPYSSAASRRDAQDLAGTSYPVPHGPDHRGLQVLPCRARAAVRRHEARHRGREPPGAHPGQLPHGALQQVRLARADHRQQVRDEHRLRHALRRHGRGPGGHQGRAQDARVQALPLPQLPGPRGPGQRARQGPTAELRFNQKDSDSLPPYGTLDPILKLYIEEDKDIESIVRRASREKTVERVIHLVEASEYKRRQSPPGIKITPRAFARTAACR